MKNILLFTLAVFVSALIFISCQARPSSGVSSAASAGSSSSAPSVTNKASVTIAPNIINSLNALFFGHNYWLWPPVWGDLIAGTQPIIAPLGIKFLRAGGQNNDFESGNNLPDEISIPLDSNFMDNFASYCSSIGAAPMFQMPLISSSNAAARVARASNLLQYYVSTKGYPLSWVDIGNEPDWYYGSCSNTIYSNSDLINTNNYFNSFNSVAAYIKNTYTNIKIIGPDLSGTWAYMSPGSDFLTYFLQNCGSNVYAVSLHYYPFWPDSAATYTQAVAQFDSITNMYTVVTNTIRQYGSGQPLMIGECQISADGNPSDPLSEASLGTIEAGLWLADFLGISSAQSNLISVMPWSLCESWLTSFLNNSAGDKPKPVYYVYEMFSSHALTNMILCQKTESDLRVYAYKDSTGNVSVFCVNWNKTAAYSISFNFTGGLLGNSAITYVFMPLSLTCLAIPANQSHGTAYTYSSSDASAGNGIETNNF